MFKANRGILFGSGVFTCPKRSNLFLAGVIPHFLQRRDSVSPIVRGCFLSFTCPAIRVEQLVLLDYKSQNFARAWRSGLSIVNVWTRHAWSISMNNGIYKGESTFIFTSQATWLCSMVTMDASRNWIFYFSDLLEGPCYSKVHFWLYPSTKPSQWVAMSGLFSQETTWVEGSGDNSRKGLTLRTSTWGSKVTQKYILR